MSATTATPAGGLNLFPGYPVISIGGVPDVTVPTAEIRQLREVVNNHIVKWRPSEVAIDPKAPRPVEWSTVVMVSGDYGTGKTHLLIDAADFLGGAFRRERNVSNPVVIRLPALGSTPAGWYGGVIGPALDNFGTRSADGGLFTQLILQIYSIAAKSLITNSKINSDGLNDQPAIAIRLVSEGLLNATSVWDAFQTLLTRCCERAPTVVRDRFAALVESRTRDRAARWLIGQPSAAGGNEAPWDPPSDEEARGILAATASLCGMARRPFALFVDEVEQFLREDDRSGRETNTTWLKRLLVELAEAGAFVAVSGHVSAWQRRRDFLDRFPGGQQRIAMRRMVGSDVLAQISRRAGADAELDPALADVVAEVCHGNMRRVLALCRVLSDQSNGFTADLTEQGIRDSAAVLGHAVSRDQALLNLREIFEARGFGLGQEMPGGGRFDLVARDQAGTLFFVAVRATPNVKEAQDLAIQFLRNVSLNRRPGERVHALFVCDTPEDRGVSEALRDYPDIDFAWFNYTALDTFSDIQARIDHRATAATPVAATAPHTIDLVRQLETVMEKRLDELDRRRTAELKALQDRLAEAEIREAAAIATAAAAAAAEAAQQDAVPAAAALEPPAGTPPPQLVAPQIQFSAADLLERPSLGFRLRSMMTTATAWIELIVLILVLLVAATASQLPDLFLHQPHQCYECTTDQTLAIENYKAAVSSLSNDFLFGGFAVAIVAGAFLLRRYIAYGNYFDFASQLIKEEYLAAPHPWLLVGANRLSRQMVLVHGPKDGMVRLQKELEDLVGRRTPKQGAGPSEADFSEDSTVIRRRRSYGGTGSSAPQPSDAESPASSSG